ncbi:MULTISPECIES: dienelactone hydrolase family protein [Actinomadura]|uniref:Dienelactone hydrolase family protein n=1 Tax=Actinomadura miaoliensis TaxID=430685 RepID=A0ABP7W102_9ACTN
MITTGVTVALPDASLDGDLVVPDRADGVVLFAHGSGSSRFSPRNRAVASGLNTAGFGTLLLDLLTADEERVDAESAALRFDIGLLTRRLVGAVDWLGEEPQTTGLPIGLFGASTGAAGALAAAAERPGAVGAVVSRGGRPDLAGDALGRVRAPVLLIVGGDDPRVLELNELAKHRLRVTHKLKIVAGATHLFEEPGALERVTELATRWFAAYLRP